MRDVHDMRFYVCLIAYLIRIYIKILICVNENNIIKNIVVG